MTRGQQHALDQYNRAEVAVHGLACPFAKSDPDAYMNIDVCKPSEGFKEPRLLFEHVWRKHTRFYHCGFCPSHWSIATPRKTVSKNKEDHWKSCEGKLRGVIYFDQDNEGNTELLNWKQQELFEKIKSIRDVKAKLKALYEACGKPVPNTYHTTAVVPTIQPQLTHAPGARTAMHPGQQSASQGEAFWDGFAPVAPVPAGPPSRSRKRTTINNVSKANAVLQAGDSSGVSGANRPRDADSGYSSMPRNNEDTDDFSPADRLPAQPGIYWADVHHEVRSHATSSTHVATASPGHITSDDDFASARDHAGHGSFQGLDNASALLYGASRDGSLMGLTLSSPGAEDAEEPLNIWAFTSLDAEFLEYPG